MTGSAFDATTILGFDPFAPSFYADPYAQFRELAEHGPLQRTAEGLWVTTSYELCGKVLRDPRFGHEGDSGGAFRQKAQRVRSFLTLDPPDHTRLRRLVGKAFTPRLIERLRPEIARLVDDLVDGLTAEADLISALAYPLPVSVISELLGVPPEDRARFQAWSDRLAQLPVTIQP